MATIHFRVAVLLLVLLLFVSMAPLSAARADFGGGGDFEDGGIIGGGWKEDPEGNYWTNVPIGIVNDPYDYRFSLVCFDQNSGDRECLARQRKCDAGENGRLVLWYRGLKGTDKSSWKAFPLLSDSNKTHTAQCIYSTNPDDVLGRIAEAIQKQFQSRPVVAGSLTLQPSPHTLIRANTNFFVESKDQVFDLKLLGQDVKIKATPTEYTWNYGDGSTYGPTRESGYVLRDDELGEETQTSHQYPETGDYQVSVTVHFTGEYSINDGPMIPIDGRGEFSTPSQTISVWKSESRLVDGTCLDDPTGWGC